MKTEIITRKQIENLIQGELEKEAQDYIWFNKFMEVIKQFEGKQITKRIETALKKAYPDITFYYEVSCSIYHMYVWGKPVNRDFNNRMMLFIVSTWGGDTPNIINEAGIRKSMCCYDTAAIERNDNRKKLLKNDTMLNEIVNAFNAFNTAKERIDAIFAYENHIDDRYNLDDLVPCYSEYPRK